MGLKKGRNRKKGRNGWKEWMEGIDGRNGCNRRERWVEGRDGYRGIGGRKNEAKEERKNLIRKDKTEKKRK